MIHDFKDFFVGQRAFCFSFFDKLLNLVLLFGRFAGLFGRFGGNFGRFFMFFRLFGIRRLFSLFSCFKRFDLFRYLCFIGLFRLMRARLGRFLFLFGSFGRSGFAYRLRYRFSFSATAAVSFLDISLTSFLFFTAYSRNSVGKRLFLLRLIFFAVFAKKRQLLFEGVLAV